MILKYWLDFFDHIYTTVYSERVEYFNTFAKRVHRFLMGLLLLVSCLRFVTGLLTARSAVLSYFVLRALFSIHRSFRNRLYKYRLYKYKSAPTDMTLDKIVCLILSSGVGFYLVFFLMDGSPFVFFLDMFAGLLTSILIFMIYTLVTK